MKKFIALLLSLIFIMSFNNVVFAEEGSYTQTSTVTYTVNGNFMIYIPSEITVGENAEIRADQINIPDDKQISVSFSNLNSDGSIDLTNQDSSDVVKVFFTDLNGSVYSNYSVIGTFDSQSQGMGYGFYSYASDYSMAKAGTYTGYVEFFISLDNI